MTLNNKLLSKTTLSGVMLTMAALAGAAIVNRQMAKTAERRHPPEGQFMMVDGVRLHFVDSGGDKLPVVLLHGNGTMIADMAISGLLESASRRYRTIAFDRPGFGYSTRPRGVAWTPSLSLASTSQLSLPILGLHWLRSASHLTKTPSVGSS
jgi:alpha/beta hydrolase fold